MVEFGGFSMPVTYSDMTISESVLWTRENASLFDVSHMYVQFSKTPNHMISSLQKSYNMTGFSMN